MLNLQGNLFVLLFNFLFSKVPFRASERILWNYLIHQKFPGDIVKADVFRAGQRLTINITMDIMTQLVPPHLYDKKPRWEILSHNIGKVWLPSDLGSSNYWNFKNWKMIQFSSTNFHVFVENSGKNLKIPILWNRKLSFLNSIFANTFFSINAWVIIFCPTC